MDFFASYDVRFARSQAPDLVIAILAGALAWFITLLLRAVGSY
jgi:hypothetical protein